MKPRIKSTLKIIFIIFIGGGIGILWTSFLHDVFKPSKGNNYRIIQNGTEYICGDLTRYGVDIKGIYCSRDGTNYERVYMSAENGTILLQNIEKVV